MEGDAAPACICGRYRARPSPSSFIGLPGRKRCSSRPAEGLAARFRRTYRPRQSSPPLPRRPAARGDRRPGENHRARAVRPQYGARRLLLAPADHTIADDAALGRAVESGASLAAAEEYLDSGNFYWNAPEILAGVGLHQVEQGRGLEQEQPGRCRADCR